MTPGKTGQEIIVKPAVGPGYNESLVDTVDDLLEFDVVPPTVLRKIDGEVYSVQEWIPDTISLGQALTTGKKVNHNDLIKIAIIDIIMGQVDRHYGNVIVEPDGHAYAIDNELIFGEKIGPFYKAGAALQEVSGRKIPPHILEKVKELRLEDFVTALAGTPKESVMDAWERKTKLEQLGRIPSLNKTTRMGWGILYKL
jgi:hypothetical protein